MSVISTDNQGRSITIPDSVYGTFRYGIPSTYEQNGSMFPDSWWNSPRSIHNQGETYLDLVTYREALCLFYSPENISGTHNGNGIFRDFIPVKTNDTEIWVGPDPVTGRWESTRNRNRQVIPTSTCNQCPEITKFGLDLSNQTFTFSAEAENYLRQPEIDRISAMDNYIFGILLASKNANNANSSFRYISICTNITVNKCDITQVTYERLPEYGVFIAKYYFPNGIGGQRSPDNYFYITGNGKLCYITTSNNGSGIPPVILPPIPEVIIPETPLIGSGSIYSANIETIKDLEYTTSTIWPDGEIYLQSAHCHCDGTGTSEIDLLKLSYGFDVYQYLLNTTESCNHKLFRVAYGNHAGLGAPNDLPGKSMTKAVYSQYASKLLGSPLSKFSINDVEVDSILIIDINLDLYKSQLDPGNIILKLSEINTNTIDIGNFDAADLTISGDAINIIVDTNYGLSNQSEIRNSYILTAGPDHVGILYPQHGIFIIHTDLLIGSESIINGYGLNAYKFFRNILTEEIATLPEDGFVARRREYKYTINCFARIKNYSFNFSNNPTFVIDTEGSLIPVMKYNPTVYPTAIGLYNDKKELLATGKLPMPMVKNFSEESIINVKISQ